MGLHKYIIKYFVAEASVFQDLKNSMERKLKFGLCSCFFVCSLKGFQSWPFGYQKGKNLAENKKKDLKCGKWSTINEKRNKNRRVIGIGRRRKKGNFI
jgi:hypothetical protein